ncbi:hypothetical protein [Streptomyces sp. NPDC005374]
MADPKWTSIKTKDSVAARLRVLAAEHGTTMEVSWSSWRFRS